MSEATKEVVLDSWKAANTGQVSAVGTFYAKDAVYHGSAGEEVKGRDAIVSYLERYFVAFPNMKLTVEDIFAEGDRVFSRVRAQGTNTGELMGLPATGKHVDLRWIMNVSRVADGKVVEEWEILDMMDMMRQLGFAG